MVSNPLISILLLCIHFTFNKPVPKSNQHFNVKVCPLEMAIVSADSILTSGSSGKWIIKWTKNTTLSKQFQKPMENRRKRYYRYPLAHNYMTIHFSGLVRALKKSGVAKLNIWAQNVLFFHQHMIGIHRYAIYWFRILYLCCSCQSTIDV